MERIKETLIWIGKSIHMRTSLTLYLILGIVLVSLALTSNHELADSWVNTVKFEYGNRFMCLIMLYLAHRAFNSGMRSHLMRKELEEHGEDDREPRIYSHPVYVAWCSIWVLSCALIISFVR